MKRLSFYFILPIIIVLLGAGSKPKSHADDINNQFKSDLIELQNQLTNLENYPSLVAFLDTRLQYKKVEWLIEFIDSGTAKALNGPNIIKPDATPRSPMQFDPTGLQVLEALIFEDPTTTEFDTTAIRYQVERTKSILTAFIKSHSSRKLQDEFIFSAARADILLIGFKGITGFDTPICQNALPEARVALANLSKIISFYYIEDENQIVYTDIQIKLREAFEYISKHNDFNSFSRFEFLQQHLLPLYAIWPEMIAQLGHGPLKTYGALNQEIDQPFSKDFINPSYYSRFLYDTLSTRAAELGQKLFYDPALAADGKMSCATCHNPELAFTDALPRSLSADGKSEVQRNAPTLGYAGLQSILFHDGRSSFLEEQLDHVVFNEKEFNTTHLIIIEKLKADPVYAKLFAEAFPNQPKPHINGFTIGKSMADYVRTLQWFNSSFDQQIRGEKPADPLVTRGFDLFMGKALCGTCHFAPVFNGTVPTLYAETEMEVIGVPISADKENVIDPDEGRYFIQTAPITRFSFKTPTIRNIDKTSPYMHNGVYKDLDQVLRFYQKGGGAGLGQDLAHQTLPFDELDLSIADLAALKAFMVALTDE
jgi:cytochrome c peroxidase